MLEFGVDGGPRLRCYRRSSPLPPQSLCCGAPTQGQDGAKSTPSSSPALRLQDQVPPRSVGGAVVREEAHWGRRDPRASLPPGLSAGFAAHMSQATHTLKWQEKKLEGHWGNCYRGSSFFKHWSYLYLLQKPVGERDPRCQTLSLPDLSQRCDPV